MGRTGDIIHVKVPVWEISCLNLDFIIYLNQTFFQNNLHIILIVQFPVTSSSENFCKITFVKSHFGKHLQYAFLTIKTIIFGII